MTNCPSRKTPLINLINNPFGDSCYLCDSFNKSLLLSSAFHLARCFSDFFSELLCAKSILARLCLFRVSGYRFKSRSSAPLPFDAFSKLGFASVCCALSESSCILLLYLRFCHDSPFEKVIHSLCITCV